MIYHNQNFCFNCGERVDPEDYEDVGNTRLWVCTEWECEKELRSEHYAHAMNRIDDTEEGSSYGY